MQPKCFRWLSPRFLPCPRWWSRESLIGRRLFRVLFFHCADAHRRVHYRRGLLPQGWQNPWGNMLKKICGSEREIFCGHRICSGIPDVSLLNASAVMAILMPVVDSLVFPQTGRYPESIPILPWGLAPYLARIFPLSGLRPCTGPYFAEGIQTEQE